MLTRIVVIETCLLFAVIGPVSDMVHYESYSNSGVNVNSNFFSYSPPPLISPVLIICVRTTSKITNQRSVNQALVHTLKAFSSTQVFLKPEQNVRLVKTLNLPLCYDSYHCEVKQ